jgi:hypothetical protein
MCVDTVKVAIGNIVKASSAIATESDFVFLHMVLCRCDSHSLEAFSGGVMKATVASSPFAVCVAPQGREERKTNRRADL